MARRKVINSPTYVSDKKPKKPKFKPNREYIQKAMDEYMIKGGTISRTTAEDCEVTSLPYNEADDFLIGE